MNPNAIHLLEQNKDKINWENLSFNPNAIHLLEQNIDKINWSNLSTNPNAIHLLEQHKNKIDWALFSENSCIFEIDKKQIQLDIQEQTQKFNKINSSKQDYNMCYIL